MKTVADQIQTVQDAPADTNCAGSNCCSTTAEGNAVCALPQQGSAVSCGCNSGATSCGCDPGTTRSLSAGQVLDLPLMAARPAAPVEAASGGLWPKIRSGVMFVVACAFSPCCAPLIVALLLPLLAGTPLAVLVGQNLGWVYGALTLVSIASFVIGWRWLGKNGNTRNPVPVARQPELTRTAKPEVGS